MPPLTASPDTIRLRSRLSVADIIGPGGEDRVGRRQTSESSREVEVIHLDPELSIAIDRPTRTTRILVRTFDLVVASLALVLLSPAMVAVALAVRLDSPGPIFYGSPRIGTDRRRFRAWKFRSMHPSADDDLADLLARDPEARREYERFHKLRHDPRLTRVGRFIRQSSLDELPQLFNIVAGQMSVVGPRPKIDADAESYGPALDAVLTVKPGLTGLWQVSGRNRVPMSERVALDLGYVERRSLRGDIWICARTFLQLWRPKKHGAY